ncbi:hypothetical protein GCM10008969_49530 [Pseudomonas veronii subsp. inensis]
MYKGGNADWKIKLHQRKWPGLLGDRNKLLQMGSRYLRTDLLQDEDVQGFLGQQTIHIASLESAPTYNQRSVDLRRFAALTSRMRSSVPSADLMPVRLSGTIQFWHELRIT